MLQTCRACTPLLVKELNHLIADGDPIRLMEIIYDLTIVGSRQGLLSDDDHEQLSLLTHLIGAVARRQKIKS